MEEIFMKPYQFVNICSALAKNPALSQRELSALGKLSVGSVNSAIKEYLECGFLQSSGRGLLLTQKGKAELDKYKVKNAVILAAGFGSRCVPLTFETPKGLLKVYGQPMIERQIEQLAQRGITEIVIVVGYKKESFDYLIDKYGLKLVYNKEYSTKNNLSSLHCALNYLDNSYILMSDFWIEENIFNTYEPHSWYSCINYEEKSNEWQVESTATGRIKSISIGSNGGYVLIGPAFFSAEFSAKFKKLLSGYYNHPGTEDFYWEHILIDHLSSLKIYMNKQTGNVHEFENLEELRRFDPSYNEASNSKIMQAIAGCFGVSESEITDIEPIKEGMTNRSFTFMYNNNKYIMRIPGEGTDMMIDRKQEFDAYQAILPLDICDDIIFIDPQSGYKITRYWKNSRVCDPLNFNEVKSCFAKLREFHEKRLSVAHKFDVFERIEYYQSLWLEKESCFIDHAKTKSDIMSLKPYIDSLEVVESLAHIDSNHDNFLFVNDEIRLVDWEYAGKQDPHIDIAMFAVYAMYDSKEQIDRLIDLYFVEGCPRETRLKIYAYVAMCGFLWSNWCEYKRQLGVEFGEYALRQYRFAKDYYKIFNEEKEKILT